MSSFAITLTLPALLAVSAPAFPTVESCDDPDRWSPASTSEFHPNEEYRELYRAGAPFDAFLEEAVRRKELWVKNWAASEEMDPRLIERARAVDGTWHILAVTVDSCSDSVNTIPWLARLAELVDGLEIRIVDPEAGRSVMEAHPTPDGRAATPTVLLLDTEFEKRGCFIERPTPLQARILENPEALSRGALQEWKMEWYEEDRGGTTAREFVEILEAAASGESVCGA